MCMYTYIRTYVYIQTYISANINTYIQCKEICDIQTIPGMGMRWWWWWYGGGGGGGGMVGDLNRTAILFYSKH